MAGLGEITVRFDDESMALIKSIRLDLDDLRERVSALEREQAVKSEVVINQVAMALTDAVQTELKRRGHAIAGGMETQASISPRGVE